MLQRRLVVLPPLLAAVLATVAGVGRDSSDYGGEYGPASRPICPPLLHLFDTAPNCGGYGTYVLSLEPAACARLLPVASVSAGTA